MPRKSQRPCAWTGCGQLTYNCYCDKHQKEANTNYNKFKRNQTRQGFYDSPKWRALRKVKISQTPMCELCQKAGRLAKAEMVDHITEIEDGGGALDIDNLQSLCRSCHSSKTLRLLIGRGLAILEGKEPISERAATRKLSQNQEIKSKSAMAEQKFAARMAKTPLKDGKIHQNRLRRPTR